jgi:hypothetical protein
MICPHCTADNQIEVLGLGRFRCDCCSKAWQGPPDVQGTPHGPAWGGTDGGPAGPGLAVDDASAAWDRDLVHQVPSILAKHGVK